jgi:hypothetical protein
MHAKLKPHQSFLFINNPDVGIYSGVQKEVAIYKQLTD